MSQQVWLITGASKGLGKSLAQKLLKNGQRVAGTSRSLSGLDKESDSYLPLEMDLSSEASVLKSVIKIQEKWGHIDVLVNNAGYGHLGAVEEVTDQEARANFEVNIFGMLNVIRNTLPIMRKQRSGHIFNISSIGGYTGAFPGFGIYCATKFAVAGLTEGLQADVAPLGINVTLVYPGYFRTDFLAQSSMVVSNHSIDDYKLSQAVVDQHANGINHNQPGDPDKAADAMIEAHNQKVAPLHLFLGPDAKEGALAKIKVVNDEILKWNALTVSTNY